MAYPKGIKVFIDGQDCTYFIFGSNTFDPSSTSNTFRDINITSFLRKLNNDRTFRSGQPTGVHTIEITAEDGNGRVEARVEVT